MTDRKGVKDYSDKATVAKGKKKYEQARLDEIDDIKAVLNTPHGKRLLWRIMDHSKLLGMDLFTGDSRTYYNLGKRDEGLWLYQEIMNADPEAFLSMMQQRMKDETNG